MSKQVCIVSATITVVASAAFLASWSAGFIIAAFATADYGATTMLAWRFIPLAVVLVAVVLATGAAKSMSRSDLRKQAVVGLFAQFGYVFFVYAAVANGITTGTTALIDAVQPLVVATLVGPLLGLRVRGAQWAGLVAGAAGVLLVVQSQLGEADAAPLAYLLPALAMAFLIVGTFLDRRARSEMPVLVTLTVHVVVAAVGFTLIAALTGTLVPPASLDFWTQVALAAAVPTFGAYGLYWWLLRRVGITALNALLFLVAPVTALAGAVLLGEPLSVLTFIGFALCGSGVAAVLVSESRAARSSRTEPVQDDADTASTTPAVPAAQPRS